MTQQLCNEYQYEDKEESSSPSPTNNLNKLQPQTQPPQYEQSSHDEATEMLAKILNMSNANETSTTTTKLLNTEDNSDSDISYWSEDERTILRAFYENEMEDENDQDNDNNEILLEKYIMDLCQPSNNTSYTTTSLLPLPPPPSASSPSSYSSAASSSSSSHSQ